ncbi:MAG TPA: hypothetical protein VM010_08865 [Chitinophagaceae bacterium]|nr:hypothetical protein [Chitinophagaceae bacterium]
MKPYVAIALLCCLGGIAQAQDVSGFWKGTLTMTGGCFPVNNIELQIKNTGGTVTGNSYHYLDVDNYVKKKFQGFYNPAQKRVELSEGLVTTFKIPAHCSVCIKNYNLVWSQSGDQETLSGSWDGKILNSGGFCSPGKIVLYRIKESAFKEVPEMLVDTGSIRLDFYDNGEIDGDSITVLVNNQVILSHQKLTAKPVTTYIKVDLQHTFQEIEMQAENLGSIPPNTALLIITAGAKRYQLFLSTTQQKSAKVRFVYEKSQL